jgi:hypothetical protein
MTKNECIQTINFTHDGEEFDLEFKKSNAHGITKTVSLIKIIAQKRYRVAKAEIAINSASIFKDSRIRDCTSIMISNAIKALDLTNNYYVTIRHLEVFKNFRGKRYLEIMLKGIIDQWGLGILTLDLSRTRRFSEDLDVERLKNTLMKFDFVNMGEYNTGKLFMIHKSVGTSRLIHYMGEYLCV